MHHLFERKDGWIRESYNREMRRERSKEGLKMLPRASHVFLQQCILKVKLPVRFNVLKRMGWVGVCVRACGVCSASTVSRLL